MACRLQRQLPPGEDPNGITMSVNPDTVQFVQPFPNDGKPLVLVKFVDGSEAYVYGDLAQIENELWPEPKI